MEVKWEITIDSKGVENGLMKMANQIDPELENALNKVALAGEQKMKNEAPKFTGLLKSSIRTTKYKFKREIMPHAYSLSSRSYGRYVERGTGPAAGRSNYLPNVYNIMNYYGVPKKIAWLIALKIKEKGTPVNPFVERTFDWLEPKIPQFAGEMADRIVAWYQLGGQ